MTVKTAATTVTSAATKLTTFADSKKTFEGGYQSTVLVYNNGSIGIEVGGPDVTFGIGIPIAAGTYGSFDLGPDDDLYGITGSGTADTRVLASGV